MHISDLFTEAAKDKRAVSHFNVSNLEMLHAVARASQKTAMPIMIGTSEGEAAFIGYKTAVALVRIIADEYGISLVLNADHHKSVEAAERAIDAGYESIHIDLSKLPYEENVAGVTEVVSYARASGRDISVEGELGVLTTDSSKVYEGEIVVRPEDLTSPEQAAEFVERTGINRFAPAVGNFHGISTKTEKHLDIERIAAIRAALPKHVAIVLHGGSGTSNDQFRAAIEAGITNVHVSTELRIAYLTTLIEALKEHPQETAPYKLFSSVVDAVERAAEDRIRLFSHL